MPKPYKIEFDFNDKFSTFCGGIEIGDLVVFEVSHEDLWAGNRRGYSFVHSIDNKENAVLRKDIRERFICTFLSFPNIRIVFFADNSGGHGFYHLLESETPFTAKDGRSTYLVQRKVWTDFRNPNTHNLCRAGLFMITKATREEIKKYASDSAPKSRKPKRSSAKSAS